MQEALRSANQVQLTLVDRGADHVPLLDAKLDETAGHDALDLVIALQNGTPSVHVDPGGARAGVLRFNPMALQPGEGPRIGRATPEPDQILTARLG